MELGTRAIGTRGELLVAEEFLKRGCAVYTPLVDIGADLVVDLNGRLQKVQVKSYSGENRTHKFNLGHRLPLLSWRPYEKDELDWYALCWVNTGHTVLIPAGPAMTVSFTEGTDSWRSNEISAVLDRLMKED